MKTVISFLVIYISCFVAMSAADSEITVKNRVAGINLGGTLSQPDCTPKAVLVLATGSGRQNRDEEIAGHKLFKTIADRLCGSGYAVIRMDDRGTGASGGNFDSATNADFVGDIASAVEYADTLFAGIPVGVLGHSEGGTIAIKEGVNDARCHFIITLAAPAWPGDSIVMSQMRALATAVYGTWEKEGLQRRLLDIAKGSLPSVMAQMMIYQTLVDDAGRDAAGLPQVQAQLNAAASAMCSDWYRDMLRYNPAPDIAAVKVPWLALNGDRDTQVLSGNLVTISELNPCATTMLMPAHNHLFQVCATGLVSEYQTIAGDISDDTLSAIVAWLDKNIAK